jgi:DNA-binding response OmpR family regulator
VTVFRLLIIEDDPGVARSLQTGLERSGFAVAWKSCGEDGTAYAAEADPHLILLDVRLPDGSGFDYCRRMRQLGLKQPIIMLTVQSEETDKVLGLEMGADDYVTKPYNLRELISRVRAQLRRAYGEYASGHGNLIFVRDLVVDLTRGQARRQEEILNLTPIEFRLLVYLAQHPGQALTRTQILESVWGYSSDIDSVRAVNVNIRRLREKIEADPGHPEIILTVPGIGYRLVA